jgi:polycystin 2
MEDFWKFAQEPMLDGFYWEHWYNGKELDANDTGYIFFENKLLGVPRIRQVTIK